MHFSMRTIALVASLLGSTSAHLTLTSPKPFGFSGGPLNRNPLNADGSDFPCKLSPQLGNYVDPPQANDYSVGQNITMAWDGTAVHGGGSCQVSLTTDQHPTKQSKFKVIASYEGGCPAFASANLGGSGNPWSFDFQIPPTVPNGKYALAWTWFNRIGNREMYMNCAPISVTQSQAKGNLDAFPDMFVANIKPPTGPKCTTVNDKNVKFPDPGENVLYNDDPKLLAPPTGCAGATAGKSKAVQGQNSGSSKVPLSANLKGPGKPYTGPKGPTSASGNTGGNAAPSAPNPAIPASSMAIPSASAPAPAVSAAPASVPAPAAPSAPPSAPAPAAPAAPAQASLQAPNVLSRHVHPPFSRVGRVSGACHKENLYNCEDEHQYEKCVNHIWTAPTQLPSGTTCNIGQGLELTLHHSKRRAVAASHARRSLKQRRQ